MADLDWTGERLVTSLSNLHGTIEHLHRYALAMELTRDKKVLDIACGEGYGSNLLAKNANLVIGVDISEKAVLHASKKYVRSNLNFKSGSTSNIPLADGSVDVVVSFETLEHHDEHDEMMREIKRVLTPSGVLIISSPEKSIYKSRDPNNPYHIKELTLPEFRTLLQSYFSNIKMFDQKFVVGSMISESSSSGEFKFFDGDFDNITNEIECDDFYNRAFFNLAVVSNGNVPEIPGISVFNGLRVLKSEHDSYVKDLEIKAIKNSYSYVLGNALLKPFSLIKKIVTK